MPTPEENTSIVATYAKEVFGNKNIAHAQEWLVEHWSHGRVSLKGVAEPVELLEAEHTDSQAY